MELNDLFDDNLISDNILDNLFDNYYCYQNEENKRILSAENNSNTIMEVPSLSPQSSLSTPSPFLSSSFPSPTSSSLFSSLATSSSSPLINSTQSLVWSIKEDIDLVELYNKYGTNWATISKLLVGKSRIEVKTRYRSLCRAAKRLWSVDEDNYLLKLYYDNNNTWNDKIALQFPHKAKNSVKSHLKQLITGNIKTKSIPFGSPERMLISRPDLIQSLFPSPSWIKATINNNKNGSSLNKNEHNANRLNGNNKCLARPQNMNEFIIPRNPNDNKIKSFISPLGNKIKLIPYWHCSLNENDFDDMINKESLFLYSQNSISISNQNEGLTNPYNINTNSLNSFNDDMGSLFLNDAEAEVLMKFC